MFPSAQCIPFGARTYDGTLVRIHHALYERCREQQRREASLSAAIIDSQSVKSAEKRGTCIDPHGCTAIEIPMSSCNLGFDPLPETTRIELNTAEGNGLNPTPGFPEADLLWTGSGTGDCWFRNAATVVVPPDLPVCGPPR